MSAFMAVGGAGWRLSALMGETKVRFNFEKKQQMVVSLHPSCFQLSTFKFQLLTFNFQLSTLRKSSKWLSHSCLCDTFYKEIPSHCIQEKTILRAQTVVRFLQNLWWHFLLGERTWTSESVKRRTHKKQQKGLLEMAMGTQPPIVIKYSFLRRNNSILLLVGTS